MYAFEQHRLGIDDDEVEINSSDEHQFAARLMMQQARREFAIISRELDPQVYNDPEFVDVVKATLLANRRAHMRILVFESQLIVRRGHLLLDLLEKLPSFIEIRCPPREYHDFNESLFVADNTAYIYRNSAERFEGTLNFSDARKSKTFMDVFEEMWNRSTPDANLRKFTI